LRWNHTHEGFATGISTVGGFLGSVGWGRLSASAAVGFRHAIESVMLVTVASTARGFNEMQGRSDLALLALQMRQEAASAARRKAVVFEDGR
jgi:hypothetical protein